MGSNPISGSVRILVVALRDYRPPFGYALSQQLSQQLLGQDLGRQPIVGQHEGPNRPRSPTAWELRVFVGRDVTGCVRHRSRLFRGTRRAAEKELAKMIAKQDAVPERVPDEVSRAWGPTTTFNDAIAGWRDNGWEDLSPLTAQRYESVWRIHIRDSLGRRRIESVGPYDIERFFRKLKADGVGRETIRYSRSVLHRACRLARKWSGNTLPNPVADTELPNFTRAELPEPVRAPTLGEVRSILTAAEALDIRYRTALVVVAATGMRRGEASTLRWSNLDVSKATISIDESVDRGSRRRCVEGAENSVPASVGLLSTPGPWKCSKSFASRKSISRGSPRSDSTRRASFSLRSQAGQSRCIPTRFPMLSRRHERPPVWPPNCIFTL